MDNVFDDMINKLQTIKSRIALSNDDSMNEYISTFHSNLTAISILVNDLHERSDNLSLDESLLNEHIKSEETEIEISKKLFPYYWKLVNESA